MTQRQLVQLIQRFMSETSIGPSTLRGQGAPGVISVARRFLRKLDLGRIPSTNRAQFDKWLDRQTAALVRRFPSNAQNWGAARKAINLFLRDSYYNQFLSQAYGINRAAKYFEVPLDSIVARRLRSLDRTGVLPKWSRLKRLTKAESEVYQKFILTLANRERVHPVHLDALLWSTGRHAAAR